jgi:peptidoglycan/LPS O-acetylase OafA/YrhL
MKYIAGLLARIHPAFWAVLIVLNTVMILANITAEDNSAASLAFLSALGCWVGFFQSKNYRNKERDNENDK